MKESDDELKDFFSSQPPEEQFEFDQENWEKFHASLKKKRKNKKRLFIYLNLLLVIGITITYFVSENKNDTKIAYAPNGKQINEPVNSKAQTIPEASGQSSSGQRRADATEPASVTTPQNQRDNASIDKATPLSLNTPSSKKPVTEEEKITTMKQKTSLRLRKTKQVNGQISLVKVADPEKIKASHTQPVSEQKNPGSETNTDINNKETISATMSKRKQTSGTRQPAESQNQDNPEQNIVKTEIQKEDVSLRKNDSINFSTADNSLTRNETATVSETTRDEKTRQVPETIVATPKPDSVAVSSVLNKDSIPKKMPSKNMLLFELGSDYLFGWKNNDKTEANGFNPVIGLHYLNAITPKIGLSAGIQYRSINNFNSTSHTSSVTVLKFGEESSITIISATKAHYLAVPLKLIYLVNSKNSIGIGYTIAYLVNVQSKVETYAKRQDYLDNSTVTKSMGYKTGFNSFDGQIAFCYRRQIYTRLYLNGELFYGIKDIKNNTIYSSAVFERSRGLKLTLTYNLINKD